MEIALLVIGTSFAISGSSAVFSSVESGIAGLKATAMAKERAQAAEAARHKLAEEFVVKRAEVIADVQRKVTAGNLAEARAELNRYAPLADPEVSKMIAMLDAELEIRTLSAEVAIAMPPDKKARLYQRLAVLAPGVADYPLQAKRQAALAQKASDELAAQERVARAAAAKRERETVDLIYLLARVEPGRELYLASDGSYIGTIAVVKPDHLFPDGDRADAILVLFKDGSLSYLPRKIATRLYKTPRLASDR